ncbi:hypothetical protein PanWU01x14_252020 [Parasponia andersonii]|uniref:Uncharacterized protein n=1 Tax=Parasponia andersonii TaxID=3476 RepID=A0A2P5BC60_PARAD|nr:hypothetical protein PanWU01x14_252020 [Parasponia andersonii]
MAEEESDESSFKLRRWQRRNLVESASSFVHGCGARQWLEELIGSSIDNGCAEEERAWV